MTHFNTPKLLQTGGLMMAALLLFGCQTLYYNTMEKFGVQKHEILVDRVEDARDEQEKTKEQFQTHEILVDRVEDARDEQEKTKEQFQTALERFTEVVNFDGGVLEEKYEILNAEFERCEGQAKAVSDRIASVEDVGEALFKEWEAELGQYSNAQLRRSSQQKLAETRLEYDQLIRSMRRAEAKIDPVLSAFRDQVLFLKHNLNASAIASLKNELSVVETDVASLIREMEAAIAEADGFIKTIVAAK